MFVTHLWNKCVGRCVFACGSPMSQVVHNGQTFVPGQGNNVYIFPGVALACILTGATTINDRAFLIAAQVISASFNSWFGRLMFREWRRNWLKRKLKKVPSILISIVSAKFPKRWLSTLRPTCSMPSSPLTSLCRTTSPSGSRRRYVYYEKYNNDV